LAFGADRAKRASPIRIPALTGSSAGKLPEQRWYRDVNRPLMGDFSFFLEATYE